MPKEEVDLLDIAEEVAQSLRLPAEDKHVTIRVSGEHAQILGVRGLLYEIVQNLCGNAVKYNVDGGSVDVSILKKDGHVVLTVADTGIGIPKEDQSRVFERFYRVDKSHSSGGTGLGLSIVKHGAAYLGARVELESELGKGSTFTLLFPKVTE